MSQSKIDIDFAVANSQANKLEEISAEMTRLANQQLAGTIETIASGWQGETAAAYIGKAQTVKGNITQTAKAIAAIAETIRSDAKRIYIAEKAALEIAETRNI